MPKRSKQEKDSTTEQGIKALDKANKLIAQLPKPVEPPPRTPNADDPGMEIPS